MKKLCVFFVASAALILFGCDSEKIKDSDNESEITDDSAGDTEDYDENSFDEDVSDDDTEIPTLDELIDSVSVTWEKCSLYEGEFDGLAECSSTEMPYLWQKPDDRKFKTYAKRYSSGGKITRQLWLLHGGPGASGVYDFPSWMESFVEADPELEVLTLDPRGAGYSGYIACEDGSDPMTLDDEAFKECSDWFDETYGEDKVIFGATHAAIDAAAFIIRSKREGVKVFVWGGSGGTFWTQRMLQFFPDLVDGVIIEGIVPPNQSMVHQDKYTELVGRKIFEMCSEDEFCSSKLPDPRKTYTELKAKLDEGHCSLLGITGEYLGSWVYNMLFYFPTHDMIPGFIYRLDRCTYEDSNAILSFYNKFFRGTGKKSPVAFSSLLFFNELFGEMWLNEDFPTSDDIETYLDEIYEDAWIASGFGYTRNRQYKMWHPYSDPNSGIWAETDVPMLMLQGKLDPSTPYDYAVLLKDHFNGKHQHFIEFPYAAHNVVSGSPTESGYQEVHCAKLIWNAFMEDPEAELDTSCVSKTLPPDFKGEGPYAEYYFGTKDYWENEVPETLKNKINPKMILPKPVVPVKLR
jgi:pimeloyl-ACP methyl ester carboxylesterase